VTKANFQGVLPICDKALSSSLITFALPIANQPQNSLPQVQHHPCVRIFLRDFEMIHQKFLNFRWCFGFKV